MRLFARRKPRPDTVPCCPDAVRIVIALDLLQKALDYEAGMEEQDRDLELMNLALDVQCALTPTHVKGRPS